MDLHKLQLYTPMAFPVSVLQAFSDFADCSSCRAINLTGECPLNVQGGFQITLALPGFQKPCQVNNSRTPQPFPRCMNGAVTDFCDIAAQWSDSFINWVMVWNLQLHMFYSEETLNLLVANASCKLSAFMCWPNPQHFQLLPSLKHLFQRKSSLFYLILC